MAIFVLMHKTEDNMEKVVYKFGPNENTMGIIEFNKIREEFNIRKRLVMMFQLIWHMKDGQPRK